LVIFWGMWNVCQTPTLWADLLRLGFGQVIHKHFPIFCSVFQRQKAFKVLKTTTLQFIIIVLIIRNCSFNFLYQLASITKTTLFKFKRSRTRSEANIYQTLPSRISISGKEKTTWIAKNINEQSLYISAFEREVLDLQNSDDDDNCTYITYSIENICLLCYLFSYQ
jgi:hypothetical protein